MLSIGKVWKGVVLTTAVAVGYAAGASRNPGVQEILKQRPAAVWQESLLTREQKEDLLRQGLSSIGIEGRISLVGEQLEAMDEVSRYQVVNNSLPHFATENLYRFAARGLATLPLQFSNEIVTNYMMSVSEEDRKSLLQNGMLYCSRETQREIASAYTPSITERVTGLWDNVTGIFGRQGQDNGYKNVKVNGTVEVTHGDGGPSSR